MDGSTAPGRAEGQRLSSPELRTLVQRYVRTRVPPADVEDVVQTVLCAALASPQIPDDHEERRRWLIGIARHKVVDLRRQQGRAKLVELGEHGRADEPPLEARQLARWAQEQLPDTPEAERTLDWMAREGAGEKLAHIAADAQLPPERVRQRVSRMRRFLRRQWRAELAAVAAIVGAVLVAWLLLRAPAEVAVPIAPEPPPDAAVEPRTDPKIERATALRDEALSDCDEEHWQRCLDSLDDAKRLDPEGDAAPAIQSARQRAAKALQPPPETSSGKNRKPGPKTEPTPTPKRPKLVPTSTAPTAPTPTGYGSKPSGVGPYGATPSPEKRSSTPSSGLK